MGDFAGGKMVDGVRIGCNFEVVNQTEKPTFNLATINNGMRRIYQL